jgi:hypothetical protein
LIEVLVGQRLKRPVETGDVGHAIWNQSEQVEELKRSIGYVQPKLCAFYRLGIKFIKVFPHLESAWNHSEHPRSKGRERPTKTSRDSLFQDDDVQHVAKPTKRCNKTDQVIDHKQIFFEVTFDYNI